MFLHPPSYEEDDLVLTSTSRFMEWNRIKRAESEWRCGELALAKSDITAAIEVDERALLELRRHVPQHQVGFLLDLTWELGHRWVTFWSLGERSPENVNEDLLAARFYGRLSYSYWQERNTLAALWAHLRELNLTDQYLPSHERTHAYADHALVMLWLGQLQRGLHWARKSLDVSWQHGDSLARAQSLQTQAVMLYYVTEYVSAIESSEQAIGMFERAADARSTAVTRCHLAKAYLGLGRLTDAIAEARKVFRAELPKRDRHIAARGLAVWAMAAEGEIDEKPLQTELAATDDEPFTEVELRTALGALFLSRDLPEKAVDILEKGCATAQQAGLSKLISLRCRVWLNSALCRLAETGTHHDLYRAQRAARTCVRQARRFRTELPHALRDAARVAALLGKRDTAWRFFAESLAEADLQHNTLEYAKTLEARGNVGKLVGWKDAADDIADGRYMRSALKNAVSMTALREPVRLPSNLYDLDVAKQTS